MPARRAGESAAGRLLSAIRTCLPGAWIQPSTSDLVALYRMRARMALEERKYDVALIFLNKIIEVDPHDVEARLSKGEIYHRHLGEWGKAIEHYNKVLRLTEDAASPLHARARASLSEIIELLS